jgi:hypothetical protein
MRSWEARRENEEDGLKRKSLSKKDWKALPHYLDALVKKKVYEKAAA